MACKVTIVGSPLKAHMSYVLHVGNRAVPARKFGCSETRSCAKRLIHLASN